MNFTKIAQTSKSRSESTQNFRPENNALTRTSWQNSLSFVLFLDFFESNLHFSVTLVFPRILSNQTPEGKEAICPRTYHVARGSNDFSSSAGSLKLFQSFPSPNQNVHAEAKLARFA